MRKILLVIAMLLAVSQVMAGVTITAVNEGTFTLADGNRAATFRVDYSGTINVRAFALDINVDNGCTLGNIRDFNVGENHGTNNGYGIFPGRFRQFINPANPAWGDANSNSNYNPTPPWGDPGTTGTGLGTGRIIVEMGYMGAGDSNRPPQSGTLFRIDVNVYQFFGTAHLTISADVMRGGVIDKDTNATTTATNLPVTVNLELCPCCIFIPNLVGMPPENACTQWAALGYCCEGTPVVDCNHLGIILSQDTGCYPLPYCVHYTYGVAPIEPNVVGMTRTPAAAALTAAGFTVGEDVNVPPTATYTTVGTVTVQNPPAGTQACNQTVHLSIVSYPIKDTATTNSFYANWVYMGRPQCWAYPRQCHGDADGKKLGNFWVSSNDLAILKGAISKMQAQLPPGGICCSFTHKKLGNFWCSSNDLAILKAYISKPEASIPICGTPGPSDPNFWYWCLPFGVPCPTGHVCALAGVCPNTPYIPY